MELNQQQKLALEKMLNPNRNVFLTGRAGTGKSFLVKTFLKESRKLKKTHIHLTSSTGISSLIIGGVTLHRFFGLGIVERHTIDRTINRVFMNPKVRRRVQKAKVLIIDEISMVHGYILELINHLAQVIRKNNLPMGGIKVICVGDFFQIAPVMKGQKEIDWAFKTEIWKELNLDIIQLTNIERSKDPIYNAFLEYIRLGIIKPKIEKFLNQKVYKGDPLDFVGTKLLARKKEVYDYNNIKLDTIPAKLHTIATKYVLHDSNFDLNHFKNNCILEETLQLKVGALVMIRINDKESGEYANGTLAIVKSILKKELCLELLETKNIIYLKKEIFKAEDSDGKLLAEASNFPVSLAWAMTIHKSQGATIDKILVNLDNLWDHGMAYVALSRVTSHKGLNIISWSKNSFRVDKEVIKFYRSIQS